LPPALLSSLEGIEGFDKNKFLEIHASGEQITSIRFNPAKAFYNSDTELNQSTISQKFNLPLSERVPWSSFGYYLAARPSFTMDPLFHAGVYYVQEASSMFIEQALRQTVDLSKPLKILDLCAAPGGKSTLIQSCISADSLLVSNEVIKTRVNTLQENIIKWGSANVIVTNNDPKDFSRLKNYFDVIVIDAPCSGSGLFRRDPQAIEEWSEENVKLCSMRQQRILEDAWPALKNNGLLVYSTCSYSKTENEDNIDWMIEQFESENIRLNLFNSQTNSSWPVVETISEKHHGYGYRFYPDRIKGEGFFVSCFRKQSEETPYSGKSKKTVLEKFSKTESGIIKNYVDSGHPLYYFKYNALAYALPEQLHEDFCLIRDSLYIRKAGILLGRFAAEELIPDHELALSSIIHPKIHAIELSYSEAIQFLRKEEFKIEQTQKGWTLAKYEDHNLGWMKVLQNRINNYYPKEWRIRK